MPNKNNLPQKEASKSTSEPVRERNLTPLATPPLPGDITDLTSSYAGNYNLFRPYTKNSELASRNAIVRENLMKHVKSGRRYVEHKEYGNEYFAVVMFSRYPDSIAYRADVTDNDGHVYKDINALELALKLPGRINLAVSIYETLCAAYQGDELTPFTETFHSSFRDHVAKGNQDEAEAMLQKYPELLRSEGPITDYSGRTFNCTAYEYAYWAKDSYMCRMLEKQMDGAVRAELFERIKATMARGGLTYMQDGKEQRSPHFDFTPLKAALRHYLDTCLVTEKWSVFVKKKLQYFLRGSLPTQNWKAIETAWLDFGEAQRTEKLQHFLHDWLPAQNLSAIEAAWLDVGKAQRNVPAHVAQEYLRKGRSFSPRPEFNEATLPRALILERYWSFGFSFPLGASWFPLADTHSGLGFDFAFIRGARGGAGASRFGVPVASRDLAAVSHLEQVRTQELEQSLKNLSQSADVTITHDRQNSPR